ncbi:Fanconi anemia protein FancD2 nuclease family protein [Acanthocheilonema viteae]
MFRRKKGRGISEIKENSSELPVDNFEFVPATPSPVDAPSEVSSTKDSLENDYPIIDEKEFRRALDRCYTQSQNGNACKLSISKITARNAFENLLEELGVEMCTSGSDETSVYLANSFYDLVKKLDAYCKDDSQRATFFDLFGEEIVEEPKLKMYLSPSVTEAGYVDTFIRALLISSSSQAVTFNLILKKIEAYAKSVADDCMKSDYLALACIAQFRYLDTIYDCERIFNSIFDCDLENWRCAPRDALIQVLPEILSSPIVQQDAANNLQQMFLRTVRDNLPSFRVSILQTLLLLRTDEQTTNSIRGIMLQNIMKLNMEVLPELVAYCLDSIHKNEKFAFRNILCSLRAHLQIENLESTETGTGKKTVGQVLMEIFEIILKKMKTNDGRYWKDVVVMLTTEKQEQSDENERGTITGEDLVSVAKKIPVLFDVLFYFALMDVNNWSHTVYSIFKQQILCNQHFQLEQLVTLAFEYTEYITHFFRPICGFFENLMWSSAPIYIQFGAHGYKTLFVKLPSEQSVIFNHIIQHLNGTEEEISTTLSILQNIAENHSGEIAKFFFVLSKKIPCLINFSFDNVCRFFNILLLVERIAQQLQITEKHKGLDFEIEQMISSSSTREKIWGIFGVLMQLQQYLMNSRLNANDRESLLKQKLALLDERTKYNIYLRTCFYQHFAKILNTSTGVEHSAILVVWAERLCVEFRQNYLKKFEQNCIQCRLEDERYSNSLHKEWLCLSKLVKYSSKISDSENRVFEPIAHFQLLLALTKLKYLWTNKQSNDGFLMELRFILEANISMAEVDLETKDNQSRITNCDIFFFCIQWIRLMLNTFAVSDNKIYGSDTEAIHAILRKRFALMMECQKSLKYTIQKIGEYRMPCVLDFEQTELIVFYDIPKKSSSIKSWKNAANNRKRNNEDENGIKYTDDAESKSNETMDKENGEDLQRDTTRVGETKTVKIEQFRCMKTKNLGRQKLVVESQLLSFFLPLNFATVIHLIELLPKKRKQTTFLLETLGKLLEELLPKKNKKISPFLVARKTTTEKVLGSDGSKIVWHSIQSVIPTLFVILHGAVEYFKNLLDTSVFLDSAKRSYYADMSALMHSSLVLFYNIFSSQDFMKTSRDDSVEEQKSHLSRMKRRKLLMEKLERAMIDVGVVEDTQGADEAEDVVSGYFISISEIVPTLNCAVSLLQLLSCDFIDARQKSKAAKSALAYLKREWFDVEERPVKGALLNQGVASILRIYLSFREQTERLSAIQWMLANKISELVPEDERRRSKISSLEPCRDKDLDETEGSLFICFSKVTFASVYKILFCSLNETIRNVLSLQAIEKGKLQHNKCFALWKIAASSFCLLTLLIRVKELRNASVLLTAAREGRLFLQSFAVKSSFIYLLSDESRFARYGAEANAILKTVQIGNRSLQNMSAHAKSTKCASLLKLLPMLRATSEQFIRAVHQLMIGVDCDSAFQIGLLKSRNLDGEELKDMEIEDVGDSQQRPVTGEDENDEMELAEEQSDVEMDLDDDSPIF